LARRLSQVSIILVCQTVRRRHRGVCRGPPPTETLHVPGAGHAPDHRLGGRVGDQGSWGACDLRRRPVLSIL